MSCHGLLVLWKHVRVDTTKFGAAHSGKMFSSRNSFTVSSVEHAVSRHWLSILSFRQTSSNTFRPQCRVSTQVVSLVGSHGLIPIYFALLRRPFTLIEAIVDLWNVMTSSCVTLLSVMTYRFKALLKNCYQRLCLRNPSQRSTQICQMKPRLVWRRS